MDLSVRTVTRSILSVTGCLLILNDSRSVTDVRANYHVQYENKNRPKEPEILCQAIDFGIYSRLELPLN